MASFKSACLNTLQYEGGYSNRPEADHGGETYMGISRRWHPTWVGWVEIDRIKALGPIAQGARELMDISEVLALYRRVFWDELNGDAIQDQIVAAQLFDHAVTCGVKDAVRILQLACGATKDGIMGPSTLHLANVASTSDKYAFRRRLFKLRLCYYLEESEKSLLQSANLPSWVRRTVKCYTGEA